MLGQTGLNSQDQLAWQAYCYVADELSDGERDAFEAELATSQTAREAVAQAVALGQAVVAAITDAALPVDRRATPQRTANPAWLQAATWTAVGAAACMAMMFLSRSLWLPEGEGSLARETLAADSAREQLAMVWARSSVTAGNEQLDESTGEDGEEAAPDAADSDDVIDPDIAVPDWLMEAVSTGNDACAPDAAEGH